MTTRVSKSLGKQGEQTAAEYLKEKGFEIVAANYRYERAEVDLVVKHEETKTLVFTEVKTRKTKTFGEPEESVTEAKQRQLVKSAEGFLMNHPEFSEYEKRFDVVTVYIEGSKEKINHIENAF